MSSSSRLELVATSMRRQPAVILLTASILAGYVVFVAVMKWSSTSVVTQFHERLPAQASKLLVSMQVPVVMNLAGGVPWERLVLVGFSVPEPWGLWTRQTTAEALLMVDGLGDGDLLLTVTARPFIHERHPRQRVHVLVNGEAVADWTYLHGDADSVRQAVIPAALAKGESILRITFHMPDARAPVEVGLSSDTRPLGIGLTELRIERP